MIIFVLGGRQDKTNESCDDSALKQLLFVLFFLSEASQRTEIDESCRVTPHNSYRAFATTTVEVARKNKLISVETAACIPVGNLNNSC